MSSKREQVLEAVKALVVAALPNATIERNQPKPDESAPGGAVNILDGTLELLGVDLSPVSYNYDHAIGIETVGYPSADMTNEEVLDAMMFAIGEAVDANRGLGGLVDYLRVEAPDTNNADLFGAPTLRFGEFSIVATYATPNPLT